jgi:2-aminoethylphosphonate-pyruvate transaminase
MRLFTPGPLTTAPEVRGAMSRDYASREADFLALTAEVRTRLLGVCGATDAWAAIPLQGSGTFAVEAALGSLIPRTGRLLVLVNGAYGRRIVQIARVIGLNVESLEVDETAPVPVGALVERLASRPTHVAVVHCETTTGLENPLQEIAAACRDAGAGLIVDAMSSFGALPLDIVALGAMAVIASSNKCLEGVPGVSFVITRRDALQAGRSHSVVLDLHAQLAELDRSGEWRFTPPTHVVAALAVALRRLEAEGREARCARYRQNLRTLVDGMRARGFRTVLDDAVQAPVIATFYSSGPSGYSSAGLHAGLLARGFTIYPGKLTVADTFRIGVIGALGPVDVNELLRAIDEVLAELQATCVIPHAADRAATGCR